MFSKNDAILEPNIQTSKYFRRFFLFNLLIMILFQNSDRLQGSDWRIVSLPNLNFSIHMIQRIQSLFLLGAALVSGALFFLPLSEVPFTSSEGVKGVLTLSVMQVTSSIEDPGQVLAPKYFLLILNLLILAASIYIIFLFKNRPAQIRLTALTGLLSAVLLILTFYYSDSMAEAGGRPHYLSGVYLIAAQTFLFMAARRFIRKDEQLVRSADRIR